MRHPATSAARRVGPFTLDVPLGSGAWGQVWRARHVGTDAIVAIKVLTHDAAAEPAFRQAFQREARTVASLDHPAIVGVLDFGFADAAAAPLPEGSPLLVMEAARGTLADLQGNLTWPELHALVARLLGALAHAHAHGVVHRDLKPRNVLVGCGAPLKAPNGLRLADFGISSGLGRADSLAGTPAYMAPEQIREGALGPWTDLYALGVVVWELVTGGLPFDARDPYEVLRAHVVEPLPPLEPRLGTPAGLEDWLASLLEKDPVGRAPTAGAALAAWRTLREGRPGEWRPRRASEPPPHASSARTTIFLEPAPSEPSVAPATSTSRWPERPPVPTDWRADAGDRPLPLAEVGLGLLGLRSPPLVGHAAARDALWRALRELTEPAALWITGPPGVGGHRVARWFAVRAAETGAVEVLVGAPREAFARWSSGDPVSLVRRLRADSWLATPLARWLEVGGETPIALLVAVLEAAARSGPVLWALDDEEAGPLARAVLAATSPGVPLALVSRGSVEDAPPGARVVPLEPLAPTEMDTLLSDVLALAPSSANALREAASGHPGVALDMVRALASRGDLVPSPFGFAFPGEPSLPADAADAWAARLGALEPALRVALERVAAAHPDPAPPAAVALGDAQVARLVRDGLVTAHRTGLAAAHPALREAAIAQARAAGRLVAHHLAWAEHAADEPERRGRHLLRAGRPEEALGPLLHATREEQTRADARAAKRVLGLAAEAVDAAGLSADDPRAMEVELTLSRNLVLFGRIADAVPLIERQAACLVDPDDRAERWSTLANALRRLGRFQEAREAMDRALAIDAAEPLSPRVRLHLRTNLSFLLPNLGDPVGAEAVEREVVELARALRATGPLAEALGRHGLRAARRGDRERLAAATAELGALLPELSTQQRGLSMIRLANLANVGGDPAGALRWAEEAHALARSTGDPVVLGDAGYLLAGLREDRGDSDLALETLREALRWLYRVGAIPPLRRMTLAGFLLRRGEHEAARAELDAVAPTQWDRRDAVDVVRVAWFAERAVLAALADPEAEAVHWVATFRDEVGAAGLRGAEIADAWGRIAAACEARGLGPVALARAEERAAMPRPAG